MPGVDIFPLVLTRVPCLPVDSLASSPFTALIAESGAQASRRSQLCRTGRILAARLGTMLPTIPRVERRAGLALRRNLFNGRSPAGHDWMQIVELMTDPLGVDVRAWVERLRALEQQEAASKLRWKDALGLAAAQLGATLAEEPLAVALATHHPWLAESTGGASAARGRQGRRRRTLWALVWRSALRPTPLGLYCSVGLGYFTGHPVAVDLTGRELIDTGFVERLAGATAMVTPRSKLTAGVELALTGALSVRGGPGSHRWVAHDGGAGVASVDPRFDGLFELLRSRGGCLSASELMSTSDIAPAVVEEALCHGWVRLRWPGDGLDQRQSDLHLLRQRIVDTALADVGLLPLMAGLPHDVAPVGSTARRHITTPPKFETGSDSSINSPIDVPVDTRNGFVSDAAHWGAALVEDCPTPARQATRLLLDVLFGGTSTPLLDMVRVCSDLADAVGLESWCVAHPEQVAAAVSGAPPSRLPNPFGDAVRDALESDRPLIFPTGGLVHVPGPRRLALRFRPLDLQHRPGSGLLTRYSGDRGSFLPRYLRLPAAERLEAAGRLSAWLALHPHLVDLDTGEAVGMDCRPPVVRRLAGPRAGRTPGDLILDDVLITQSLPGDIAICHRVSGEPLDPIYLGVLAPDRLPVAFRFLLTLGSSTRSALELALHALNTALHTLTAEPGPPRRLDEVWMTDRLLLLPESGLVPCDVLARSGGTDDRSSFLEFHRMAARVGLPAGWVSVSDPGGSAEPQSLDLRYPDGLSLLARRAARSVSRNLLISTIPSPCKDAAGLRYNVEYCVELTTRPGPVP